MIPLLITLAACASRDEPLEVVPNTPNPVEHDKPAFRWEARFETPETVGGGLEVWVPLPQDDPSQSLRSLVWELSPPGTFKEVATEAGDRLLKISAPPKVLHTLRVKARFERTQTHPRELPSSLLDLDAEDPKAWVAAAREQGTKARLVHGVRLTNGETQTCSWPEIRPQGNAHWVAVNLTKRQLGLPNDHLRLATVRPWATRNGERVTLHSRYTLARDN